MVYTLSPSSLGLISIELFYVKEVLLKISQKTLKNWVYPLQMICYDDFMIGIVIFGIKNVSRKLAAGIFSCPQCRHDTPYTLKKVSRYITLYFIPLIPLGKVGEIVQCDECGSEFGTDILSQSHQEARAIPSLWTCSRCGNVNPAEYVSCVSCQAPRKQ
jgi:hypothetical protein